MPKSRDELNKELEEALKPPAPSEKRAGFDAELDSVLGAHSPPVREEPAPAPSAGSDAVPISSIWGDAAKQMGQTATDLLQVGVDAGTLGLTNKATAKIGDLAGIGDYESNKEFLREDLSEARERLGPLAVPGAFGGMAFGGALPGIGKHLIGKTALGTAARGAGFGGAVGTVDAYGHDRNLFEGAATGFALGPLAFLATKLGSGIFGSAKRSIAGALGRAPKVTPGDELLAAKNAAYKAVDDLDYKIKAGPLQSIKSSMRTTLKKEGIDLDEPLFRNSMPNTARAIDDFEAWAVKPHTFKELETARQALRRASLADRNKKLTRAVLKSMDDFTENLHPDMLIPGKARVPIDVVEDRVAGARQANSRYLQAEKLEDLATTAARKSETPQAEVRTIREGLFKEAESPYYTPAQKDALTKVASALEPPKPTALTRLSRGTPVAQGAGDLALHSSRRSAAAGAQDDVARLREMIATGASAPRASRYAPGISREAGPGLTIGTMGAIESEEDRLRRIFTEGAQPY